jgi:two-component system, cell cycle response regulator DivK
MPSQDSGSVTGIRRTFAVSHQNAGADPEAKCGSAMDGRWLPHGTNLSLRDCGMDSLQPRALVLLVDDNADMRQLYSLYLEHEGFETEQAAHGFEAFDKALKRRPDVIVMDLRMPKLDGWEAVRLLKNRSTTHAIPIIALTGDDDVEHLKLARNAGCDVVLQKPCAPDDLHAALVKRLRDAVA